MSVFDRLDQKAEELAAQAKEAIRDPAGAFATARAKVEAAVRNAQGEIEEFAGEARDGFGELRERARTEFREAREKVADLLDPDRVSGEVVDAPAAAAPAAPPADPTEPPAATS